MIQLPEQFTRWLARSEVRLLSFGLSAVVAAWLGFFGVNVPLADQFVKRFGYYVMFGMMALWGAALWRLRRGIRDACQPLCRHEWLWAGLVIALFSLFALTAEQFRSKILYDEFVLQSTAYNMHFFRDCAAMVRGYDLLGVFVSTDNYLDKRPLFYPFLISLAHDLTGYRSANAYWINGALMPVALALAYALGRALNGLRGGFLAVFLLGSLPLLAQNATGSGMELLNVCMLLGTILLGAAYLRRPDDADRLSAFVLTTVLLAQTRYESALYAAPAAVVIFAGWCRLRRPLLTWAAILAPLLMVPYALQNRVIAHTPILWELRDNKESRFSLAYLSDNLVGAYRFLFSTSTQFANSLFLSVLGGLSLLWLIGWLLWRRPPPRLADPAHLSFACFGLGMLVNTVIILFYYWANFDDPITARFSLPLHLLLAFGTVLFVAQLDRRLPASPMLLAALALFTLGASIPRQANHLYSHLGIDEIEWEKRWVASQPPGERLIVSNKSTLPWLLEKKSSILLGRATLMADRLAFQLQQPLFREILVMQSLRPATAAGDHQLVPEERLPSNFHLELLAEKRFGTKLARISRLVAVDLPAEPPAAAGNSADPRDGGTPDPSLP